jgi:hypothetical protein
VLNVQSPRTGEFQNLPAVLFELEGCNFSTLPVLTFEGARKGPLGSDWGTPHCSIHKLSLDYEDGEVYRASGFAGLNRAANSREAIGDADSPIRKGKLFRGGYALRQFIKLEERKIR